MKQLMKTIAIGALIFILTVLVSKVYLHQGFPYTHDGENHLARFANYKIALKEGQFPPRFAPNLMNHYGYPVFNFNYPLANILSLPFSFLKLNYQLTFKIIATSSLAFGLTGLWFWLKKLKVNQSSAIALSLINFSTAPFIVSLFYHRGNIGEILAVMILPWLFSELTVIETKKIKKRAELTHLLLKCALWSAFFLSHNITVMFGTGVVFLYFIFQKPNLVEIKNKTLPMILGLLASLWFWVPAIFEKSFIILDGASLTNGLKNHFTTTSQLLLSPLAFGFSFIGQIDTLTLGVGLTSAFAVLVASLAYLKLIFKEKPLKNIKENRIVLSLLILSIFSLVFQLKITEPIWSTLPLINFIQFPWRLTLFFVVSSSAILGILIEKSNSKLLTGFVLFLLLFQVIAVLKANAVDYFNKNIIDYDLFSQSTSTLNENLPKDFTYQSFSASWKPEPSTLGTNLKQEINVLSWTGTKRTYTIKTNQEITVIEPTMSFAGWETKITPENEDYYDTEYVDSNEIGGRIAYLLEPGSYSITTEFTQNTFPRIVGNIVSLGTIIATICCAVWLGIKNEK